MLSSASVAHGTRWLALLTTLALGCAGGAKTDDTTTFGAPGSGPPQDDGGTTLADDTTSTSTSGGFGGTGSDGPSTTGSLDDGTTGSLDEGTTTFGDESSGDDGPVGNCADPGTCAGAGSIGSVSGDEGSRMLGSASSQPAWRTFLVSETDDAIDGAAMSFTVTLTSPAGADFDLYVYRGVEGGGTGCGGFLQSSTGAGAVDEVSMTWGEGLFANGLDDSAWVAVEIVAKDHICAPPAEWSLTVVGNT